MPLLTIENVGSFQVPAGKRLVNALVDECGTDQLHACGGNARCTTCKVKFIEGRPEAMTVVEKELLASKGLTGDDSIRLSCQLTCDADMTLQLLSRLKDFPAKKDAGARCADEIMPPPQWSTRS